jgi:hypothetical protein
VSWSDFFKRLSGNDKRLFSAPTMQRENGKRSDNALRKSDYTLRKSDYALRRNDSTLRSSDDAPMRQRKRYAPR